MTFDESQQRRRFQEAWNAVKIARPVHYSLFTFGESILPYYLVCGKSPTAPVSVTQGEVRIERPMIITPENARPEFRNFFEDADEEGVMEFFVARTAHFSHLRLDNHSRTKQTVSDSMEATIARLNRKLDAEDEDRIAILTAPAKLGGVAVLRYAAERVWQSGPENIQELRERGFLP
jgi:hypothetical protein